MKELEARIGKPLSITFEKLEEGKRCLKAGDQQISSLFSKMRKRYILETRCETVPWHNLTLG